MVDWKLFSFRRHYRASKANSSNSEPFMLKLCALLGNWRAFMQKLLLFRVEVGTGPHLSFGTSTWRKATQANRQRTIRKIEQLYGCSATMSRVPAAHLSRCFDSVAAANKSIFLWSLDHPRDSMDDLVLSVGCEISSPGTPPCALFWSTARRAPIVVWLAACAETPVKEVSRIGISKIGAPDCSESTAGSRKRRLAKHRKEQESHHPRSLRQSGDA